MRVAILGPAGFGGSHVSLELLKKGHEVTGISRSPEKLGAHERYKPISIDLQVASIAQLVDAFRGHHAIVNAYNPPAGPNLYRSFLETVRKIIIAVKAAQIPYLVVIGGTGSLELGPTHPYQTVADSREMWLAYRRAVADSEAATAHMEERIGAGNPMSAAMRSYRNARITLREGKQLSDAEQKTIKQTEDPILTSANWIPDLPIAARATILMYEGNTSFRWSFVSPSSKYRPGPRTGRYEVVRDIVPLAPESARDPTSDNAYDGRLLGISAADLALAIADEVEKQEKVGWHWTAVAELPDDEPVTAYATI
ncbi:hypothetical protein LTR85_012078 [Meristemomyces frigidus]|nr:hypothetical protein LTR85_012078 [Meristemomyces frigidus]